MFHASVSVQVGMGNATLFWSDRWLDGSTVADLAPDVCAAVSSRVRRTRTVTEVMYNVQWIRDISDSLSMQALAQYVALWEHMQGVHLSACVQDHFMWKLTTSQQYSVSSAYRAFFHGQCGLPGAQTLAKTRAPGRCKFFIWLSLLDRCWTSVRLQCHNLQNSGPCILCSQAEESMEHLLVQCIYSREVWLLVLRVGGFKHIDPTQGASWLDWWLRRPKHVHKDHRKCFDSLVVFVDWRIWKERNQRVFHNPLVQAPRLAMAVLEEGRSWLLSAS
jgi:hypothetical protein